MSGVLGLTRIPPPVQAYGGGVCQDPTTSLRKRSLSPIFTSPSHRADYTKGRSLSLFVHGPGKLVTVEELDVDLVEAEHDDSNWEEHIGDDAVFADDPPDT